MLPKHGAYACNLTGGFDILLQFARHGRSGAPLLYISSKLTALLYAEGKVNLLEQYPKPTSFASHSLHGGGLFKHNRHLDSGKRASCVGSGNAIYFACCGMNMEFIKYTLWRDFGSYHSTPRPLRATCLTQADRHPVYRSLSFLAPNSCSFIANLYPTLRIGSL